MSDFRGLTKEGKWVHGWYLEMPGKQKAQVQDEGREMVSCKLEDAETVPCIAYKSKTQIALDFCVVIPETVGRSTGLKDKNGKERYAGDIESYDGDMYEIIWCQEFAGFFWRIIKKTGTKAGRIVQLGEPDKYEGNIHENSELLAKTPATPAGPG